MRSARGTVRVPNAKAAIACTLEEIQSQSGGRMETEVIGQSAGGHDMYKVTINALDTRAQRNGDQRLRQAG